MIIQTQNKEELINFENIMNVEVTDCDEEGFGIFAGFIVGRDDNYRLLGYYKSKERATEILQEIASAYSDFKYYAAENGKKKTEIGIKIYQNYRSIDLYEMPEK